jgi:UDP-2,3-diacylglucosamine hydrolase
MISLENQKCFFSADYHLNPGADSSLLEQFLCLCKEGDHCFFLGDFFEVWYENKKNYTSGYDSIIKILKNSSERKINLHLIKGNRDFLAGQRLKSLTGMTIHNDSVIVESAKQKVLLIHGDELLSQDTSYQKYKKVIRSKPMLALAKNLPTSVLKRIGGELRNVSKKKTNNIANDKFKPDFNLIDKKLSEDKVNVVIAGHLHEKMQLKKNYAHGDVVVNVLDQSGEKKINYKIFDQGKLSDDLELVKNG